MALIAFAQMLNLSAVVGVGDQEGISASRIWTVFILNAFFGLGFGASAIGLWMRHQAGRLLFIGMIVIWSGLNIIGLFTSPGSTYSWGDISLNLIRYLIGLVLPPWYLNLAHIKALFHSGDAEGVS
jgi:hypothetical protein